MSLVACIVSVHPDEQQGTDWWPHPELWGTVRVAVQWGTVRVAVQWGTARVAVQWGTARVDVLWLLLRGTVRVAAPWPRLLQDTGQHVVAGMHSLEVAHRIHSLTVGLLCR